MTVPTWIKGAGSLIAAAVLFLAGYRYAAAIYSEEMAALREAQARAVQQLHKEQIGEIEAREKRLAAAVDERDAALSRLGTWERSSAVLLERMRNAELRANRMSAASVGAGDSARGSDERGRALVARCGGLVDRCGRLLGELNADRSALKKIIAPRP